MNMCLSKDAILKQGRIRMGEPATLAQRWDKWKAEFELYVAASGVEDKLQKRALLLHLAGPGVREIFKTYPDEVKGA